jgi:hypothetical protein
MQSTTRRSDALAIIERWMCEVRSIEVSNRKIVNSGFENKEISNSFYFYLILQLRIESFNFVFSHV